MRIFEETNTDARTFQAVALVGLEWLTIARGSLVNQCGSKSCSAALVIGQRSERIGVFWSICFFPCASTSAGLLVLLKSLQSVPFLTVSINCYRLRKLLHTPCKKNSSHHHHSAARWGHGFKSDSANPSQPRMGRQ